MIPIESTRNPRVRAALELRERRGREAVGATLVDGVRELGRALEGGAQVVEAFVDHARLTADGHALVARLAEAGVPIVRAGRAVIERLGYGDRSEGVVAIVRVPDTSLAAIRLPEDPLVVVVEAVEKPGNLGAILRSADATGADAVIAADPATDLFNPNAVRASLGTIFTVPVASGDGPSVRAWLASNGLRLLAARVDGDDVFDGVDLRGPLAIVLGSEATGLTDGWRGPGIDAVRLPMLGVADSLNVSVAAAVLLYEARRQRGRPPARDRSRRGM